MAASDPPQAPREDEHELVIIQVYRRDRETIRRLARVRGAEQNRTVTNPDVVAFLIEHWERT